VESPHLSIHAVIFDIYGTLLEVGPPPPDAEVRWADLFREVFETEPPMNRLGFSVAAASVVARHHAAARARGIAWPEVNWPAVVAEVLPEVARLPPGIRDEFLLRHIRTGHTTRMADEVVATLRGLKQRGCLLGIASNAQAYTLQELRDALAVRGMGLEIFEPDLCFWSFQHGFSKPDPHVFQILTTRLAAHGIGPSTTLMVGDRLDNDIGPARAHGWQTWQAAPSGNHNLPALVRLLQQLPRPRVPTEPPDPTL
jgi:putative hydrolase of the HAD superfamily